MVYYYVKNICVFLGMYTKENRSEVIRYLEFTLKYFSKKREA